MTFKAFLYISISFILSSIYYFFHVEMREEFVFYQQEIYSLEKGYLTAVTYNIQYGKGQNGQVDLGKTIIKLQAMDAQIISLQEVERYSVRSGFQDQVKLIAEGLDMHATFYPSLKYPGLYYGNAILSKYPMKEVEILYFPSDKETRTALIAKLTLREEEDIYIVNTHLGLNHQERQVAIEKIYTKLTTLDAPVLLMGDLNAVPAAEEYTLWNDVLSKSNVGTPLVTYYKHDWQIDYIFHSREFHVLDTFVIKSEVSDHYPLVSVFHLQWPNHDE